MNKSPLTSHVLNLSNGKPAEGIAITLYDANMAPLASAKTDDDGRVTQWDTNLSLTAADYCLEFEIGAWCAQQGVDTFFPKAVIHFRITDPSAHTHVPLLLSPFGYSTYRGS